MSLFALEDRIAPSITASIAGTQRSYQPAGAGLRLELIEVDGAIERAPTSHIEILVGRRRTGASSRSAPAMGSWSRRVSVSRSPGAVGS